MAYVPTYASGDISPITIDVIASIFVVFASLATILGLVILYRYISTGDVGL